MGKLLAWKVSWSNCHQGGGLKFSKRTKGRPTISTPHRGGHNSNWPRFTRISDPSEDGNGFTALFLLSNPSCTIKKTVLEEGYIMIGHLCTVANFVSIIWQEKWVTIQVGYDFTWIFLLSNPSCTKEEHIRGVVYCRALRCMVFGTEKKCAIRIN